MFANVSKDRDSVDATAKIVNEEAVSVRAVSHIFSVWLALPSVNINREPYSNPHAIRAITKKNISFAYFIGLNTTTLNKLDGIPYATVHVDIKEGGGIDRARVCLTLLGPSLLQQVFYIGCKTTYIDVALKVSSLQNSGSFLYRRRLGNQEMLQSSIDS